ncbi:MAG: hypothetical protein Q4D15_08095 [Lachnospiraceae bacterium]|nr:hypothetical protein [Lachnospiraceae bacterium]
MPPFRGPTPYRPIYYFGNKKSTTILVQMVERHQVRFIDKEMAMIRELAGTDDFLLACVRVVDCNEDLTPWMAPGIFGNSDFSGRGPQTLDYLLKEMIPMILHERDLALAGVIEPYSDFSSLFPPAAADSNSENHAGSTSVSTEGFRAGSPDGFRLGSPSDSQPGSPFVSPDDGQGNPHDFGFPRGRSFAVSHTIPDYADHTASAVRFFLGGYSLGALFALWTAYQTDVFSGIAAASPSLWYPDFIEYMEENKILTDAVYLSIGTKEEAIRNRVMSRVGDGIRAADEILSREGILKTFEWNQGKHFQDQEKRTAMGFAWLLKNRFAWTLLD